MEPEEFSRFIGRILGSAPVTIEDRDAINEAMGEADSFEELPSKIQLLLAKYQGIAEGRALPKLNRKPTAGLGHYGGGNPNHDKKGKFTSGGSGGGVRKPKGPTLKNGEPESLSREQYDLLKAPDKAFSGARVKETVDKLSSTPEGAILAKYADDFQHQPSAQFRNEIAAVNATGRYQSKAGSERAKTFLKASSEVPPEILPKKLYRGVTVGGTDAKGIAEGYRRAGKTTMNVSSFTESPRIARQYTTHHVGAKGPNDPFVKVITTVNIDGKKAQMLPIQSISRGPDVYKDQEYLGLGTFKITNVAVRGNEVHLDMEPVGMILPKGG